MFCFQKDGGIKSLKVETLDPSLGQYDVVWLLDRGEAEGAWQLGQVTSYLVIYIIISVTTGWTKKRGISKNRAISTLKSIRKVKCWCVLENSA